MKKIALMTIFLFAVSAGSALAAYTQADASGSLILGTTHSCTTVGGTVKLSKSVLMDYVKDTNGLGYVVGAYHGSGTRSFSSSSSDSKIFYQDGTGVAIPSTAPIGTATISYASPWTAL